MCKDAHLGPSLPPHLPSGSEGEERGRVALGCCNHHGPSLPPHLPSGGEGEEGGSVALGYPVCPFLNHGLVPGPQPPLCAMCPSSLNSTLPFQGDGEFDTPGVHNPGGGGAVFLTSPPPLFFSCGINIILITQDAGPRLLLQLPARLYSSIGTTVQQYYTIEQKYRQ